MKTYFKFRESNVHGWVFGPVWDEFVDEYRQISGSFSLLACRVSGLSWPQWLQFCRQNGATIYGKGRRYPIAVWKEPNRDFEKMMNERANALAKLVDFKKLNL